LNLGASFGNLAIAQGMSKDETELLVGKVAELAGDLASFNDADPEAVFEDLNKALLTTEREGMKKYGIAISEVEVKQRALELATEDGRTEVSQADRVMAAYEISVRQAGSAVGDLGRTSDSTKNQQRQLKASTEELQQQVGEMLLPVMDELVGIGNDLIPVLKGIGEMAGGATGPLQGFADTLAFARDPMRYNIEDLGAIAEKLLGLVNPLFTVQTKVREWAQANKEETAGAAFAHQQAASDIAKHVSAGAGAEEDSAARIEAAEARKRAALESTQRKVEETTAVWKRNLQDVVDSWNRMQLTPKKASLDMVVYGIGDDRPREPSPSAGKSTSDSVSTWNQINGKIS